MKVVIVLLLCILSTTIGAPNHHVDPVVEQLGRLPHVDIAQESVERAPKKTERFGRHHHPDHIVKCQSKLEEIPTPHVHKVQESLENSERFGRHHHPDHVVKSSDKTERISEDRVDHVVKGLEGALGDRVDHVVEGLEGALGDQVDHVVEGLEGALGLHHQIDHVMGEDEEYDEEFGEEYYSLSDEDMDMWTFDEDEDEE